MAPFALRAIATRSSCIWLAVCALLAVDVAVNVARAQTVRVAEHDPAHPLATESALPQPSAPGDDFDSLLRLAEEDVSGLTRVRVSERSPSLQTVVSTVSRTPSTVGKSPAAVFVITNEMIRRSGALCIPEALRMAPGVNVARLNSSQWAVSIRGFNGLYTNKLLVQIDGRSVYSPFFGGVIWPAQDVLLEDVERIEVIRGPGGSVWGANAMNGVINIISKKASDTQGLYAQSGAGNYERGFVNLRYGGQIGEDIDYRIYGKWFERGTGVPPAGTAPYDDWRTGRGGFRLDWDPGRLGSDLVTVQGDMYETPAGARDRVASLAPPFLNRVDSDVTYRGSNALVRWTHIIDDQRDWQIQAYYDNAEFTARSLALTNRVDTYDVDFQSRLPLGDRHKLVWGAGYRLAADSESFAPFPWSFTSPGQDIHTISYFFQDEISLSPDLWSLTLGCKFLHNTYAKFEYQPTIRLLHTPDDRRSMWASVSRAVRTPTRYEESAHFYIPTEANLPVFSLVKGNDQLLSEDLLAWECGYREQTSDAFSWDLALFFNQYEDLVGLRLGAPEFPGFGVVIPLTLENNSRAQTYGFELGSTLKMSDEWELRAAYSFLRVDFLGSGPQDEGLSPTNQLYVQSSLDLPRGWELDLIGRYTDSLPAANVPSYFVTDVRLAWQCAADMELFVVGRGLFDNGHREFSNAATADATGVRAEVYAGFTIRH